jgi:hypothetical protein
MPRPINPAPMMPTLAGGLESDDAMSCFPLNAYYVTIRGGKTIGRNRYDRTCAKMTATRDPIRQA